MSQLRDRWLLLASACDCWIGGHPNDPLSSHRTCLRLCNIFVSDSWAELDGGFGQLGKLSEPMIFPSLALLWTLVGGRRLAKILKVGDARLIYKRFGRLRTSTLRIASKQSSLILSDSLSFLLHAWIHCYMHLQTPHWYLRQSAEACMLPAWQHCSHHSG